MKTTDISGRRFGMLVAISPDTKHGYWLCECDCGNSKPVHKSELTRTRRSARSCGCMKKLNGIKHGLHGTRTYEKWRQMRSRVRDSDNPKNRCYKNITICKRWDSFKSFLEDMGEAPDGLTLERINGLKGYSKSNCKWATPTEQNNNHSGVRLLSFMGKTQSMKAWSVELGIGYSTLANRLNYLGWPVERSLSAPSQPITRSYESRCGSSR